MSKFFRTAIYTKNISNAERTLRLLTALGAGGAGALLMSEPGPRWVVMASAMLFLLTGVLGFCPACYMAGRKLKSPGA